MSYVDGFVLPVPKRRMREYRKMAEMGRKAWMKHGALDYKECAGDDLAKKWGTTFTRMMKLKPGETAVFAYIVFKSRAHRDRVNAKVIKEMKAMVGPPDMPVDMKRMVVRRLQDAGRVIRARNADRPQRKKCRPGRIVRTARALRKTRASTSRAVRDGRPTRGVRSPDPHVR